MIVVLPDTHLQQLPSWPAGLLAAASRGSHSSSSSSSPHPPPKGSPQSHFPYPHTSPSSYSPPNLRADLNDRIGWARTMQQEALPSHSSDSSFDRLEIFESKATLLLPFNNSDTIVIITYLTLPLTAALAAGAAGHRWLLQR